MAPGRTAFLRQTAGILRHDALSLQMAGHAQQLADGDDPGAPDASHHAAPGLAIHQRRHLRHRQHGKSEW